MSGVDAATKGGPGTKGAPGTDCAPLLVAAIDFGTTFSGYAFSFLHDFKREPLKISSHTFAGARGLMSLKTSTCLLFDSNKKLIAFGFDAEEKYADLALDGEHDKYYYFRRFKMELFGKLEKTVHRNFDLTEAMGKKMPALEVFSTALWYLKDLMLNTCKSRVSGGVVDSDIRWVITVPAIWNDKAKQFMREAAVKAGIASDRMAIALEPEAASLYCRYLPLENFSGVSHDPTPFRAGAKYIVLDAGGGTIDITIHEVQQSGALKELHKAEGGDWGGTNVDSAFENFLADIVGPKVMEAFQGESTSDFLDVFREFEVKKRSFKPDMDSRVTFKVPIALNEIFTKKNKGKEIKSVLADNKAYAGKVTWVGDKLRVDCQIVKELFKRTCDNIVQQLKELFSDPEVKDANTILMVGGFSESPMLQHSIQTNFAEKRIIIPQDAGLAVLKGAVIFGHDSKAITSRKCKYTYGVKTSKAFDASVHPQDKKYKNSAGKELCDDIFDQHVCVGKPVEIGVGGIVGSYRPTKQDQKSIVFSIYASDKENPTFTTDTGSFLLGTLTVELDGSGLDRGATVQMVFGGTELEVIGTDKKTGKITKAVFNFLD